MGLNLDEQKAIDKFRRTVVEPSMTKLVILDFFAEWCGPCKVLTPMLEKVAGEYADKGVVLVKIDVDKEQFIAAQFQVQSIPTVYAMFQGQPVADLTNARSESQLKQTLDQLLAQLPLPGEEGAEPAAQDAAQFLAMGDEVLASGDAARAAGIFAQVIDMVPGNAAAHAGLIRSHIQAGEIEQARAAYGAAAADPALASDPAIVQAKGAFDLAANRVDDGELVILRAKAAESPTDFETRFAFAEAAFANGERDTAADELLGIIGADREWNEGAAKAKLLQIFEAVGLEDPWVVVTRRRLSRLLFG